MEANEQKPKHSEFEKDFVEFNKAKNKFLEKHGKVIGGFRTTKFATEWGHIIELETITDEKALNENYDMKN